VARPAGSAQAPLWGYVALIVAGGAAALWASGWPSPPLPLVALVFWTLANTLCEILWLPAPEGRGYLSMATSANFATLLILPPGAAIAATALAGGLADAVFRHRKWYQVLFNMGMTSISVAASSQVFTALGGVRGGADEILSPLNAPPLLFAAVTFFLANTWLVAGVVAISQGRAFPEVWRTQFAFNFALLGAAVLLLLGYFFAVLFLTWGYLSAFLAAATAYFVRDAYGRFVREVTEPRPTLGPTP
jgi:MASE9 protein